MAEQQQQPQAQAQGNGDLLGDEKVRAFLTYTFLWFTAILFILIEKSSNFVLFNAWQCFFLVLVFIPLWIIAFVIDIFVKFSFAIVGFCVWCVFILIWLICVVQVFRLGPTPFQLPLIGMMAMAQASKTISKA